MTRRSKKRAISRSAPAEQPPSGNDITERTQAERSQELFRTLVDQSSDLIQVVDPETGRFLDINERTCHVLGYSREELLSLRVHDIDPKIDDTSFPRAIEELRKAGFLRWEGLHRRKNGSVFPVEVNVKLVQVDREYAVAMVRDTTARTLADAERELLTAAIEQAAESVVITDVRGRIQYVNAAFEHISGYTRQEVLGQDPRLLKSGKQDAAFYREMWDTLTRGDVWAAHFVNKRKDGALYHQQATISGVRDRTGQIVSYVGVGRDISREVALEDQLEHALRYARTIVDASTVGIITYKASGEAVAANPAAATLVEGTIEQLQAQNFRTIESWKTSGLLDAANEVLATGSEQHREVHLQTTFGRSVWCTAHLVPFQFEGEMQLLALFTDVTERRRLEEQFRQAQKMEAVGQLTSGIAHDFNNILSIILGNAELVTTQLGAEQGDLIADVRDIEAAARRGAAMISKLLGFSRHADLDLGAVSIKEIVASALGMLRRLLPEDIEITVETEKPVPTVRGDAGAIEQMLVNLATNARDAMPGGGALRITAEPTTADEDYSRSHPWVEPGTYVCLAVSDTGIGMDAATKARIFEPFFTTKPPGQGTGLGMAMIYGLMKQHRGFVHVYSEVGKGTVVRLYFPTAPAEPATLRDRAPSAEQIVGGHETLLLAEDEDALRRTGQRVLERLGYTVLAAADGEEALALYRAHKDEVDLVISDIVMPKMGGPQLYETLRQEGKAVKFLYSSGYAAADLSAKGGAAPGPVISHLRKPWTLTEIARAVREALDAG